MTTFEKVIKYIATGFAALLAVGIVIGILEVGYLGLTSFSSSTVNLQDTTNTFDAGDIKSIVINNSVADVEIITTDKSDVKIDANDVFETYECKIDSKGVLSINNHSKNILKSLFNKDPKITIYLPEKINLKSLELDGGVGDIEASGLSIEKLIINGGVGDIDISDSSIENGDFNMGVGDFTMESCTLLNASIDNGVGDIKLDLHGDIDDYSFDMDNGIGEIRINNKKSSYYSDNNGKYTISCDNGIGDIKININ